VTALQSDYSMWSREPENEILPQLDILSTSLREPANERRGSRAADQRVPWPVELALA